MEENYWNRTFSHRVSRRGVLRGAGVVGAGLAGAALMGCGDDDDDDGGGTVAPTGTATGTATPQPTPPDPFSNVKRGGILNLETTGDPPTIDPYGNLSFLTKDPALHTYSRLYKIGARADLNPNAALPEEDLAESAESSDAQNWVVKIKQGVKFHNKAPVNGREVTTADLMFSWGRMTADDSPGKALVSTVAKFEAVDDYTLNIELSGPSATFKDLFADANAYVIMPTESDGGFDPKQDMIGSGPWVFEEYIPSSSLTYAKNPEWFVEGKPFTDGIKYFIIVETQNRLAQLRAGNIHEAGVPSDDVLGLRGEQPDLQWRGVQGALLSFLYFSKPEIDPDAAWQNPLFRQAISMLFDRDLLTELGYNLGRLKEAGLDVVDTWNNWVPAGFTRWWLDPQSPRQGETARFFEYNVPEATKIFAANGWEDTEFTYQYTSRYTGAFPPIAEAIGNYLVEGGLKATFDVQDYSSKYITQTFRSEFTGIAFGYETPFPEVGAYFPRMFGDDPANHSRISDPKMDQIAAAQAVELDEEARRELIFDAQVLNMEQGYYIPNQAGAGTGWTAYRPEVRGIVQTRSFGDGTEQYPNFWLDT